MAPTSAAAFPVLLDLHKAWSAVPYDWALLGLCIYIAGTCQELRRNFLAHFWTTLLYAFGGGTVTSLLIMRPDKAPIAILTDGQLGLLWLATWWVMNYFPYQIPAKIHNLWPVKMVTLMCVVYCKDRLIVDRVNLACELYPGTVVGPLVLGTLAGCAGAFICDSVRHAQGILHRPHEFNVPTFSWRSAFIPACIYFFAAKYARTAFLLPDEATAVILTLFVGHVLLTSVTGMDLDWTQVLQDASLTLLNIPIPCALPASTPAKQQPTAAAAKHTPKVAAASESSKTAAAAPTRPAQQAVQLTSLNGTGSSGSGRDQGGKQAAEALKPANGVVQPSKGDAAQQQNRDKANMAAPQITPAAPAKASAATPANGVAKEAAAKANKKAKPVVQPGWTQVVRKGKKE